MFRVSLILLGFCIAYINCYAQEVRDLSVDDLFEFGIANSMQIQSSIINVEIAENERVDKMVDMAPDINIGFVGGYVGEPTIFQKGLSSPTHPNIPDWDQNYSLELVQPIYQGGRLRREIEYATIQRDLAKLNVERDIAEIKLLLIGKYLDLINLYKQQEVIKSSMSEARVRLHDIIQMEKNGMVTASDLLRSELQLSNYELTLTETQNNIIIVTTQLDIALGFDEQTMLFPDSTFLDREYPLDLYDEYVAQAYENYPEMKIAQSYIDMARKNSQIVKSNFLPTLSLKAGNILARPVTSASPSANLYGNNWNIGFTLSYNLSSLYHNKRKLNISRQNITLQDIEQQRVMQDIRNNVKSSYVKHQESLQRIATLSKSVEQANENYRIVLNKYKSHIAILTDLIDASRLQLEAQLQLTTAKSNFVYTYYKLLRSIGMLNS